MDRTGCVIVVFGLFCVLTFLCHAAADGDECPTTSYACHNSSKCIPIKYKCDGDKDCPLGDDEEQCDHKVSGCGDSSQQNGVTGSISSMGYPSSYYNMADCLWRIEVPPGRTLILTFDGLFDLEKPRHGECVYDRVSVFQDGPLIKIGDFCGSMRPSPIYIDTNNAVVEFLTDRDNVGRGFRLVWTSTKNVTNHTSNEPLSYRSTTHSAINTTTITTIATTTTTTTTTLPPTTSVESPCPFTVLKGGMSGEFKSPTLTAGVDGSNPATCRWLVTVNTGYFISLDFESFHLSEKFPPFACQDGSLEIYDGSSARAPLKEKLCGPVNPGEILSTSRSFLVVLTAPKGLRGIDFHASYIAVSKPVTTTLGPAPIGCDGTPIVITSTRGFITSPNFDGVTPYRNFLDCRWILLGKPGLVFTFSFADLVVERSADCRFDYVRIADNANNHNGTINGSRSRSSEFNQSENSTTSTGAGRLLNTTFCSFKLPLDTESKTANVTVTFHSDDQIPGLGFNMTFQLGPPEVVCSSEEFKCGSGECIDSSLVCDGHPSCNDSSDEIICPNGTHCGKPSIQANLHDHRIVGGAEAVLGAWPWTVSIQSPGQTHQCGASLILPGWAISAAHCFDRVYDRKYGGYSIVAGRHELRHRSRNEQRRYVDDVYTPTDYVSSTSQNDIALVKLTSPFDPDLSTGNAVDTVCLPDERVGSGQFGWITGWGDTLNTCCAGKLKQATVPVLNQSLCQEYYGARVYEHMMCAGYPQGGMDSCHGDSGGPLVVQREPDEKWELQGITSWGELCGAPRTPGVYTVVHDFLRWIRQTIALHQD